MTVIIVRVGGRIGEGNFLFLRNFDFELLEEKIARAECGLFAKLHRLQKIA